MTYYLDENGFLTSTNPKTGEPSVNEPLPRPTGPLKDWLNADRQVRLAQKLVVLAISGQTIDPVVCPVCHARLEAFRLLGHAQAQHPEVMQEG